MQTKDTMQELNEMLDSLKVVRERHEEAKAKQAELLAAFQQTAEWEQLQVIRAFAAGEIEQIEAQVRMTALDLSELCAEIPERVTVKMFNVVEIYDELKAKEWCIDHFTPALKLDGKVFEKAAKDGNIPADLVKVFKEPRAQIATKL